MIRSKIWIAIALVSFTVGNAQQAAKTRLTVQVTDVAGAAVRGARVEVGLEPDAPSWVMEADWNGKAEFDLPVGNYQLLVKSQGFCPHKKPLEVLSESQQIVEAKLQIDSCPGPCAGPCLTVYPDPEIQTAESRRGHLSITVTDQAGAVIPGTQIGTITPPSKVVKVLASTNSYGEAAIDLEPGLYVLSAAAPGFKPWIEAVDVTAGSNQSIKITALLHNCTNCVEVAWVWDIPSEPEDLTMFIPLLPTHNLALPAHPTHKRPW